MVVMDEEEFPKPGHVMAIIEAMNKTLTENTKNRETFSRNSMRSFGLGTSLIFTKSTLSVSSSSIEGSTSADYFKNSDELEAIYDNYYTISSSDKPSFPSHLCQTKPICVCQKKKCGYLKAQKNISKSLSDLDDASSIHRNFKGNCNIIKYFSYKKDKSDKTFETAKTLPASNSRLRIKKSDLPIESFQISENLTSDEIDDTNCKSKRRCFLKTKRKQNVFRKEFSDGSMNGHTTLADPETSTTAYVPDCRESVTSKTLGNDIEWTTKLKRNCKKHCICKKLTVYRLFFLLIGLFLFVSGATYDIGLKYLVNSAFNGCWGWLRKEYIVFGENFIEYQKYTFHSKLDTNLNEIENPELVYVSNENEFSFKGNERFFYILKNLEFSFQIHFFNILDDIHRKDFVNVRDVGPLYFKVLFKRDTGFEVKYIPHLSNMTLTTAFEMFDIMKALLLSNQVPYFGFHIKDYYQTTPNALLKVFIDALNKFKINTSFLSPLKTQILNSANQLRKKRSEIYAENQTLKYFFSKLFLPPPTNKRKTINFPITTLKRNVTIEFKDSAIVSGISCYSFILKDETKYNKNEKLDQMIHTGNELVRENSYKDKQRKTYSDTFSYYQGKRNPVGKDILDISMHPEAIDLNPIIQSIVGEDILFLGKQMKTFPFWISTPHFLSSSKNSFSQKSEEIETDGLTPDETLHGSFVYYHPLLGAPMNASIAFQIGVYPPTEMFHAQKLVPIMWIRIQLDKMHPHLWYLFWGSFYIRAILITFFIINGLAIIFCTLKCRCGRSADEQMV